ncbi:MAG: DNA cytosine methyltransferase [Treponema sp.]|nr:DNA cytosine methyltransferase [Treponema sp.]
MKTLKIVDMFCGGGGESSGLMSAADEYDFKVNLSAINHWKRAIDTHAANFPFANHFCESVQNLQPDEVCPDHKVDLLWASPECTHHSNARGGQPRSEQSRASAWEILRWCGLLYIERVIIENVPEFMTWGPLDEDGHIIEKDKGKTFRAFIQGLRSLGYTVDWRVLCAADYGAPTTRKRLFIQAVKGRKKILWPEHTNTEDSNNLFGLPKWRSAAEIIDWSIPCPLITKRSKTLAPATIRRIEHGMRKYWGTKAEPFLAILRGTGTVRSLDKPLPTVTCSGAHYALVQPFITAIGQTSRIDRSRHITKPLSTICTKQEHCLVTPFITEYYGNGKAHKLSAPLLTLTTKDRFGLVLPDGIGVDVGFRMLQPNELAAATGFPSDYKFIGTKVETVKQIGNAVPPVFAKALLETILKEKVGA